MTQFWDTDEEEEIDAVVLSKKPASTNFTPLPVVTLCKKCMQPVELQMIPGTKRIEFVKGEDAPGVTTTKILSVADYERLDLCFYHSKKARGEIE